MNSKQIAQKKPTLIKSLLEYSAHNKFKSLVLIFIAVNIAVYLQPQHKRRPEIYAINRCKPYPSTQKS